MRLFIFAAAGALPANAGETIAKTIASASVAFIVLPPI
jgi:hypothetical protein